MRNTRNKISERLKEMNEAIKPEDLETRIDDLVDTTRTSLDVEEPEAKQFVAGMVSEGDKDTIFNLTNVIDKFYKNWEMLYGPKLDVLFTELLNGEHDALRANVLGKMGSSIYNGFDEYRRNLIAHGVDEGEGAVSRGIEHGMNPETDGDKYEEYRELMNQLVNDEGEGDKSVKEGGILSENKNEYNLANPQNLEDFYKYLEQVWTKYCGGNPNNAAIANDNRVILYNLLLNGSIAKRINQVWSPSTLNVYRHGSEYHTANPELMTKHLQSLGVNDFDLKVADGTHLEEISEGVNNPVKLKNDVTKVLGKLDMSSIQPYLAKIDNPTEQAEMIAQFAEKIGVPKTKLSSVIQHLRNVSENTVTKNIIRTIKVKDIK